MKTNRIRPFVLAVVVLAAGVALSAHMAIAKSLPAKDAVLTASPARVQVWFTQAPSAAVSALTVEGAGGAVTLGKMAVGDENSLVADVAGTLAPGAYTIRWQSAGNDGHVMKGEIPFSVAAAR